MKGMNRRGSEKLLSIWWFLVLAIAGGAIVIGVILFYSAEVDTRTIESAILYERIADCINQNGFIDYGFFDGTRDIYKECDLKKGVFEKGSNLFFEVDLKNAADSSMGTKIVGGDATFKADCGIAKAVEAEHFPRCFNGSEQIVYRIGGQSYNGKIVIYVGSNQHGTKTNIGGAQLGA